MVLALEFPQPEEHTASPVAMLHRGSRQGSVLVGWPRRSGKPVERERSMSRQLRDPRQGGAPDPAVKLEGDVLVGVRPVEPRAPIWVVKGIVELLEFIQ